MWPRRFWRLWLQSRAWSGRPEGFLIQTSAKLASPEHASAGNACLALRRTGTQNKLQVSDPSS